MVRLTWIVAAASVPMLAILVVSGCNQLDPGDPTPMPTPTALIRRVTLIGKDTFETIQEAIDAAEDGDTIELAAGNFEESPRIEDTDNLTIRGATKDGLPASRILAGGNSIEIFAAQYARMESLAIIGGGIVLGVSTLTLVDTSISDADAAVRTVSGTYIVIERATFTDVDVGVWFNSAHGEIRDTLIQAREIGIFARIGGATLSNVTIDGPKVGFQGDRSGGIVASGPLKITNTEIAIDTQEPMGGRLGPNVCFGPTKEYFIRYWVPTILAGVPFDASGNYWDGRTTEKAIHEKISDCRDASGIGCVKTVLPALTSCPF